MQARPSRTKEPMLRRVIPVCVLLIPAVTVAASAENYPVKPIRLIVGFTPGGSDDLVGRMVAGRITERLGQTVIVDNRPGAGGNVGVEMTARATPDGYTI